MTWRRWSGLLLLHALPLAFASTALAAETPLPSAHHLSQQAEDAHKQGMPLILLVSMSDCHFCEQVRKHHLAPMARAGAIVVQIHLDSDEGLHGFDRDSATQRQIAQRLGARLAPTVFFLDASGKRLAEPIVGAMLDDFYGAYLDDAIAAAKKTLSTVE